MISNGLFKCLFSEMSGDLIVKMKNQEEASPFPKKTTENCKFCRTGSAGSKLDTTTMFPPPNSCKTAVHQLTAYHTLLMAHKILVHQKPRYLYEKLKVKNYDGVFKMTANMKLSVSRGGFIYRSSRLFNMLPLFLRMETNIKMSKGKVKKWVQEKIEMKPS